MYTEPNAFRGRAYSARVALDPEEHIRKVRPLTEHPRFKPGQYDRAMGAYLRNRSTTIRKIEEMSASYLRQRRDVTRALEKFDTSISRHVTGDRVMREWTRKRNLHPLSSPRGFLEKFEGVLGGVRQLAERWREEFEKSMPPNWLELGEHEVLDVGRLMSRTGWSLAWTPSGEVVQEVLAAEDDEARKAILVANDAAVVADLERLLEEQVTLDTFADVKEAAGQAVAAYRDGHYGPAQSHAATVVTTVLAVHFGHQKLTVSKRALSRFNIHTVDFRLLRPALVITAVRQAIEGFDHRKLPEHFNRACSAHRAQKPQFTRKNALTGIMLAVTFVVEVEHITRLQLGLDDAADADLDKAA